MYAKPDPKKLAAIKARADAELARAQEIEAAYREHRTGQVRYVKALERDEIALNDAWSVQELVSIRTMLDEDFVPDNFVPMDNHPAFQTAA